MSASAETHRVAVVGAGAFGGWAAWHLARAGCQVTLVDAWGAGNARSSSGGESRVLRRSYGGDQFFAGMANRALDLWREFETERNVDLFRSTDLLWMASGGADDAQGHASLATMRALGIEPEQLTGEQVARRFPAIGCADIDWAYIEPGAGALLARRACAEVRDALVARGGIYRTARATLGTRRAGGLGDLLLDDGTRLEADTFVLATGPWMADLVPELGGQLSVTRQEVFYFGVPAGDRLLSQLPVWFDNGDCFWYGIPDTEGRGFKLADDTRGETCHPTHMDRTPSAAGLDRARAFLSRRFPALADAPLVEARVCQYAGTCDDNFIADRHPELDNVWLAGAGSGHGFKHGPAMGEHVSALVLGRAEVEPRFAVGK